MSLIPMIFSNWWEDLENPHYVFDQYFGVPLSNDDLLDRPVMIRNPRQYWKQRPHPYDRNPYDRSLRYSQHGTGVSTVLPRKDKFQVNLDVQQFAPNEICVKISGRNVIVEGKHEEKQDDHGWISRQFIRKYHVPEQCDIDTMQSQISSDGVLTITALRKEQLKADEKLVRIQQTGQPSIREGTTFKNMENSGIQQYYAQQKSHMQQQRGSDKNVKAA